MLTKTTFNGIGEDIMWEQIEICKKELEEEYKKNNELINRISNLRLILFLLAFVFIIIGWNSENIRIVAFIAGSISFAAFIILLVFHSTLFEQREEAEKGLMIVDQYEKRRGEGWKEFKETGSSFICEENKDLMDLNILGKNSLFQWLNIANSRSGKRKFANHLTRQKIDEKSWKMCQEAVCEMSNHFTFSVGFQTIISNIRNIKNIDFEEKSIYPDSCRKANIISIVFGGLLALGMIGSLVLSLSSIISFKFSGIMMLFCICWMNIYSYFHKKEYEEIGQCIHAFGKMEHLIEYVSKEKFSSEPLLLCKRKIEEGKEMIHGITKISYLYYAKENKISNIIFNTVFILNPLLIFLYRKLMKNGVDKLKEAMEGLEQIELYLALTGVAWCKDNVCLPKKIENISMKMENVQHPLLSEKKCVPNDFSCEEEIIMITGSNMSGKTSFMRTIGSNLVLMFAGTYVNATYFEAPFMKIFTSIGVQDDISRGISTFYGELLRIKKVLEYAKDQENEKVPFVVFIDEIFKGTNYNDRIFGAKAVIHQFAREKCITFITTHDFELCELPEKKVSNYFFSEKYEENQIVFSHKIHSGQSKTTNARYLMERIGILSPSN